jgi:hypothetical protein
LSRQLIEAGLFDAAEDDIGRVLEAFFSFAEFIVQVGDALAIQVLQFHPFQIVPDSLSRFNSGVYPGSCSK